MKIKVTPIALTHKAIVNAICLSKNKTGTVCYIKDDEKVIHYNKCRLYIDEGDNFAIG